MMTDHGDVVHPRPQLAREGWIDLSGSWGFAYDDGDRGLDEGWPQRADVFARTITVPFPPESPASGIGDPGYHPVVWYRRAFANPCAPGQRLLLHCGAVDYRASVWVNGHLVATHEGGHTPFQADVTAALRDDGEQVVVIRAEDAALDLAQPRGKQNWLPEPHAIWYQRTTGIWQPVWLEAVAPTRLASLHWSSDLDRRGVGLDATIERPADDTRQVQLRVCLRAAETVLADEVYTVQGTSLRREIQLDAETVARLGERLLWSPEHPNLIEATLTVLADGESVDEAHSYTGLRSVGVGRGRFLLNGRTYFLRLALEQGYWPESHLAAPSPAALRREVELAKELGFNGVRIHQKVEDPRFLYWCDRLGLLVWGEIANAFVFSETAVERLTREWLEVVERDRGHPCIVAWVPLNESWGVPQAARDPAQRHFIQAMYHLTKALDPSRPVIDNDGWDHLSTDIMSIHDYAFDGAMLRERYGCAEAARQSITSAQPGDHAIVLSESYDDQAPLMVTEFGGISYRPAEGASWFGYGTVTNQEDYLAKYRELVDALIDSPVVAGFCYTQLTDTVQETNGLLTESRAFKLDPNVVRAITSRRRPRH